MGDRISIQFKNEDEKSVVLFAHWDGTDLIGSVKQYLKERFSPKDSGTMPLGRKEPGTVMIDFIIWYLGKQETIQGGYYLEPDETRGDNSDNGHWIIDLKTLTVDGDSENKCPNCFEEIEDYDDKFCRWCGAKLND